MNMRPQPSVLVIDDEQIVCNSCHQILSKEKYKIDVTTNPHQGLKQALTNNYDVVLLDINMDKMDGLRLLSSFREKKPDTPVIIITGYPSKKSKEDSNKLNVSNYVLKPFQPKEILEPVNNIIRKTRVMQKVKSPPVLPLQKIKATPYKHLINKYQFLNSGWKYIEVDGTLKAGGIFPSQLNRSIESIRLPEINDLVFYGLPLAEVTFNNKSKHIIPSAASGKILEVNNKLIENPSMILKNDFKWCWIVKIEPNVYEESHLNKFDIWKIIYLSEDYNHNSKYCKHFNDLGCEVYRTNSFENALELLIRLKIEILFIDSISFPGMVNKYIEIINQKFPDVKLVVFDITESNLEKSYRNNRIFYYAKYPISHNEISDILYSAFCYSNREEILEDYRSTFLPPSINKICITNKYGKKVTVLAFDKIIFSNKGIGYQLIKILREKAYPLEIDHTWTHFTIDAKKKEERISNAKSKSDRVIILQSKEIQRIPGNILIEINDDNKTNITDTSVMTISIQPKDSGSDSMNFDTTTIKKLSEIIEFEMAKN